MQIVGTPLDDATVLRVAHAYESATPWRARRPMLDPNTTVANTLPPVSAPGSLSAARCDEIAAICRRAGLTLNERHFQQLCATAPYVQAKVGVCGATENFMRSPPAPVSFS